MMMKNRYQVELVKHRDEWLIRHVTVDNVWRTGDPTVLAGVWRFLLLYHINRVIQIYRLP